jgi:hypothetical protein
MDKLKEAIEPQLKAWAYDLLVRLQNLKGETEAATNLLNQINAELQHRYNQQGYTTHAN